MDKKSFGEYIRKLRKNKKMTIRQLALYSDVSNAYISQVENGDRNIPSPDILKKISKPLGVDYEELMVKAGYMDEVISKFPDDLKEFITEDFIDLINDVSDTIFADDLFTKEDYIKAGIPDLTPIKEYVQSLPLIEKIRFIQEFLKSDETFENANNQIINFIKAISGKDVKINIDLSDESIIDKLNLYYEDMELTKEEKIEFLAIAQAIFSARRALREKD